MRISDWSSDVCSSDLFAVGANVRADEQVSADDCLAGNISRSRFHTRNADGSTDAILVSRRLAGDRHRARAVRDNERAARLRLQLIGDINAPGDGLFYAA